MSESHATPRRRPQYRLLHERRPAEQRWSERQGYVCDELGAAINKLVEGEDDYGAMRQQQLLLVVGTICMDNARPEIWRQIYEAWDEAPTPGGELALLDELKGKAQLGEI
jgi:hypothetical protein